MEGWHADYISQKPVSKKQRTMNYYLQGLSDEFREMDSICAHQNQDIACETEINQGKALTDNLLNKDQ